MEDLQAIDIGEVVFLIKPYDTPWPSLANEQIQYIANHFAENLCSWLNNEFEQIDFNVEVVYVHRGCLLAKCKIFIKVATATAIVLQLIACYPDIKPGFIKLSDDVGDKISKVFNQSEIPEHNFDFKGIIDDKICLKLYDNGIASWFYLTKSGDTISEIAKVAVSKYKADDFTLYQFVFALYKYNPNSFFTDNINDLKSEALLTLPSIKCIKEIEENFAYKFYSKQNAIWKNKKT
jgi:FimV-like protein